MSAAYIEIGRVVITKGSIQTVNRSLLGKKKDRWKAFVLAVLKGIPSVAIAEIGKLQEIDPC